MLCMCVYIYMVYYLYIHTYTYIIRIYTVHTYYMHIISTLYVRSQRTLQFYAARAAIKLAMSSNFIWGDSRFSTEAPMVVFQKRKKKCLISLIGFIWFYDF